MRAKSGFFAAQAVLPVPPERQEADFERQMPRRSAGMARASITTRFIEQCRTKLNLR